MAYDNKNRRQLLVWGLLEFLLLTFEFGKEKSTLVKLWGSWIHGNLSSIFIAALMHPYVFLQMSGIC